MLQQLGLMDPLQLRFTELCIEKRRMLNELAELSKQAKEIHSEIHCILDCYMELVDVEEALRDDDWSDGEVDEVSAAESAFSEYGFLGDSDEEILVEQDNLKYLLLREQQIQIKSPKRKRSRSPRRQPQSTEPSVVKESSKPEYPIVVGRAINRITINQLGRLPQPPPLLAEDPLSGYQWHPRGFESKRKYIDFTQFPFISSSATLKRTTYICRCELDGSFSISLESNLVPVAHGTDPNVVWSDFTNRFPEPVRETLKTEFSSLTAFFGLDHEATKRHLRQYAV